MPPAQSLRHRDLSRGRQSRLSGVWDAVDVILMARRHQHTLDSGGLALFNVIVWIPRLKVNVHRLGNGAFPPPCQFLRRPSNQEVSTRPRVSPEASLCKE